MKRKRIQAAPTNRLSTFGRPGRPVSKGSTSTVQEE